MSPPDLSTKDGRAAYRAELRGVARAARLIGFLLILAGAVLVFLPRMYWSFPHQLVWIGYFLIATGWAFFAYAIVTRSRHHRRRMDELRAQLDGESQ